MARDTVDGHTAGRFPVAMRLRQQITHFHPLMVQHRIRRLLWRPTIRNREHW